MKKRWIALALTIILMVSSLTAFAHASEDSLAKDESKSFLGLDILSISYKSLGEKLFDVRSWYNSLLGFESDEAALLSLTKLEIEEDTEAMEEDLELDLEETQEEMNLEEDEDDFLDTYRPKDIDIYIPYDLIAQTDGLNQKSIAYKKLCCRFFINEVKLNLEREKALELENIEESSSTKQETTKNVTEVSKTESEKEVAKDEKKADAPKAETAKVEAPKAEAPKAEAPKTEAPKAEAPKSEPAPAEAPKVETPKEEAPKEEVKEEPAPAPEPEKSSLINHGVGGAKGQMVDKVNQARIDAGVGQLNWDSSLAKVAQAKADDLVENAYFAHESPTYGSPFDMIKSYGISFSNAAENLAGTVNVDRAHTGLMNSPGHRKNILNGNYTHIGIGVTQSEKYGNVYVQLFIRK